jgi:predicted DNA-binding WGR domain protein/RNA polymerase subunit RPABC4/transcription elongation factor Spt4
VVRYFEFIGADEARGTANSAKFWQARVEGSTLYVTYGKIGSSGTTTVKEFPTPEAAETAMSKAIAEKTRKGYLEVNATAEPSLANDSSNSESQDIEVLDSEQPASKVSLNELSCEHCGETVDESDRFCGFCGEEIDPAPPTCGNCGFEVKEDARFCGNCGLALNSAESEDEDEDEGEDEDEDDLHANGGSAQSPLPEGLVDWVVGSLKRVYEGSKTKRVELRTGKASDFVFSVEVDSGTFDYCFSVALVDPEQLMGPDYTEFSEDDASFPGQRIHFFQPFDLHTNTADLSALVTDTLQDVSTDILQLWITETGLFGEKTLKQDWVG